MHTHTLYFSHLYISPKKKNKKEKEKKRTELTLRQACACSEKKKKRKKERKILYLNSLACFLHARIYIYTTLYVPVYRLLCSYSSTVLLLISSKRIVSILIDHKWKEKKKKESNWEEFPREIRAEIPPRQKAFSSRESCLFEARIIFASFSNDDKRRQREPATPPSLLKKKKKKKKKNPSTKSRDTRSLIGEYVRLDGASGRRG